MVKFMLRPPYPLPPPGKNRVHIEYEVGWTPKARMDVSKTRKIS